MNELLHTVLLSGRGEDRSPGVLLVGDRRTKQCHEVIAKELVDSALVPVDFSQRHGEESY